MSLDDYKKARKLAQRQSRRASAKGESPYPIWIPFWKGRRLPEISIWE